MKDFDTIVQNGKVFVDGRLQRLDIGVRDGKFAAIPCLSQKAETIIDARDKLVLPGMLDAHTHMGIPIKDTFSADDFNSGSIAAACGGVTTIIDFTVQEQGQTLHDSVKERLRRADGKCHVDYGIHVNITDRALQSAKEIPQLIARGYKSYKVFTTYDMMLTLPEFREVLMKVHSCGGLVSVHAEDDEMVVSATKTNVEGGNFAPIYHARSRTAKAEARAIEKATRVAREVGAPLYIVHLSSKDGLKAGLAARRQGTTVYMETCPQYLILNEECYLRPNGHYFITTPPLRTKEDNEALWQALADGEIDVVATDHCSFTTQQKESGQREFHCTPNGLPGVETLFPLMYSFGVAKKRIDLKRLIEVLAENPARIFGISSRKGKISKGADADMLIWDPRDSYEITGSKGHGKADWSPYQGVKISGRLSFSVLRGQIIAKDGEFIGAKVFGELQITRPELDTRIE